MIRIDQWLIARVESVAHLIQSITGWDCLSQARACYAAAGVCELLLILTLRNLPLGSAIVIAVTDSMIAALYFYWAISSRFDEDNDRIRDRAGRGLDNYRKIAPPLVTLRVLYLYMSALAVAFSFTRLGNDGLFMLCLTAGFYLESCNPRPPTKLTRLIPTEDHGL